MEPFWDYDASIRAFSAPAADGEFFADPGPYSYPVLCAELAQLVFSHDRAFVARTLARAGFGDHEWFHHESTDALLARGPEVAVLVFRGTEPPSLRRLIDGTGLHALFREGRSWRSRIGDMFHRGAPYLRTLLDQFAFETRDLMTDLNAFPRPWAKGGQVHRGFAEALSGIWTHIAPTVMRVETPVLYTGCSLGAALATLAASLHPPAALHAFGSPMLGDHTFATTLDGVAVHRYVNCCDIACRLPPRLYTPVGALHYIDRFGRIGPAEETDAERNEARLAHLRRHIGQWDKVWIRDISDHAPENYRRAVLRAARNPPQSAL